MRQSFSSTSTLELKGASVGKSGLMAGKRGLIIPKRPAPGPVTIRPKGLMAK